MHTPCGVWCTIHHTSHTYITSITTHITHTHCARSPGVGHPSEDPCLDVAHYERSLDQHKGLGLAVPHDLDVR